jgi:hypothetical protein
VHECASICAVLRWWWHACGTKLRCRDRETCDRSIPFARSRMSSQPLVVSSATATEGPALSSKDSDELHVCSSHPTDTLSILVLCSGHHCSCILETCTA